MVLLTMIAIAAPIVLSFLLVRALVRRVRPGAWALDLDPTLDARRIVQRKRLARRGGRCIPNARASRAFEKRIGADEPTEDLHRFDMRVRKVSTSH
jgi:hypothetical protein